MIATMPDGRLVRLIPQDGPPAEPGLYLAEYTPRALLLGRTTRTGERHTIAREVRIDGAGRLDHGPDSARLEWWARIVFEAPGGGLIRGATVGGEANDQRGEGAGSAEPSTPGREVVHLARGPGTGVECNTWMPRRMCSVAWDERLAVTCPGCLQQLRVLLEGDRDRWRQRAKQAEARVAELEAAQRWVPVGERLPGFGKRVEIVVDGVIHAAEIGELMGGWYVRTPAEFCTCRECFGEVYIPLRHVTHWRHLPAGPEVQP